MNSDVLVSVGDQSMLSPSLEMFPSCNNYKNALLQKINNKSALIGVVGLGYVGLPLAVGAIAQDFKIIGLDNNKQKISAIKNKTLSVETVEKGDLEEAVKSGLLSCTHIYQDLRPCDVIVICVPTPLSKNKEPDLSHIVQSSKRLAQVIKPGTLVILESTTYPGTTREVVLPIYEKQGLVLGRDFFLAFSPERDDPGNKDHTKTTIPKIVAGECEGSSQLAEVFYNAFLNKVVAVSSTKTAEAIKITENIFRSVNIALMNELKIMYDAMGIDIWEVIEGAKTKGFGYMPFYPGPGVGGHCIPIDPFYLQWKAREYDLTTRFVGLAGEINNNMPRYVLHKTRHMIDAVYQRGIRGTRILVVGVSYKKNISDTRDSPALKIMNDLMKEQAEVDYFDPLVEAIPDQGDYLYLPAMRSISTEALTKDNFDACLIVTDHDDIDYSMITDMEIPIIDTRNVIERKNLSLRNVMKA